jgi:hypothetical protein
MTDYSNWKILKTEADEKADEYSQVAEWCNENGQYTIEDDGTYYKVVEIVIPEPIPPTDEEIRKMRERAYAAEVDGITAHIQRLRDTSPMTAEVEAEIAELIAERDAKVAEIKERYPYNEEGK